MSTAEAKQANTSDQKTQDSLVIAMMRPEFYPKPPAEVTHQETHISHLFFAGNLVYKLKKPVRYSFLDYSTLEKRRFFLQAELRLNRRLAPSVYIGVSPIACDELGWRMNGVAEAAEYTLIMRRLPDRRMLPFLLDTGQLTPTMMGRLAEVLANFHGNAQALKKLDSERYVTAVSSQWSENLDDIRSYVGQLLENEDYQAIARYGREFVERHREIFKRRAEQGWIRDVHGDLHCEHICFAPEGIQIFDCIEFSSRLRCCDLVSEIGFLVMDLEARGGGALVKPFLSRYHELLPDADFATLIPFAKCYRALVRGKVHALRGEAGFEMARRYFRYAASQTWDAYRPFMIMISGLTGSGKSTLARALSQRLGVPTINSDVVRKSLIANVGRQAPAYGKALYSPTMTEKTYAKLARMADVLLGENRGVIVDATLMHQAHRQKFLQLAAKHEIPLLLIYCSASDDTTRDRLERRLTRGDDVSDGRWEVYRQQKKRFQSFDDIPSTSRFDLSTDAPVDLLVSRCEGFLRGVLGKAARSSAPDL